MSRTHRDHEGASCHGMYWLGLHGREGRDVKIPTNPPGWFKRMWRRIRRARERMAMARGHEPPRWKKSDKWSWD